MLWKTLYLIWLAINFYNHVLGQEIGIKSESQCSNDSPHPLTTQMIKRSLIDIEEYITSVEDLEKEIFYLRSEIETFSFCKYDRNKVCPSGWTIHGTSCYGFMLSSKQSWQGAQTFCKGLQSELVVIGSTFENEFLRQKLRDISTDFINKEEHQVWIGYSDSNHEDTWMWVTPTDESEFTGWGPDEPNGGWRENCGTMFGKFDYRWNDSECSLKYNFICEINMCY